MLIKCSRDKKYATMFQKAKYCRVSANLLSAVKW